MQRRGVLSSVLRGLFWPFGIVVGLPAAIPDIISRHPPLPPPHIFRTHAQVRVYRGFWWVLGFRPPQEKIQLSPASSSPERHSVSGRKRLRGLTRLLLCILPRWLQRALGFPSYSSIGRCVSPGGTGSTLSQCASNQFSLKERLKRWKRLQILNYCIISKLGKKTAVIFFFFFLKIGMLNYLLGPDDPPVSRLLT